MNTVTFGHGADGAGRYRLEDPPSGEYYAPGENAGPQAMSFFDLTLIRGVLYRQRYILLASVIALLALGFVVSILMTPIYKTTATVVVDPYGQDIVEGQNVDRELSSNDVYPYMQTLGKVIGSRRLAANVYDQLTPADRQKLLGDLPADFGAGMNAQQRAATTRTIAAGILAGMVQSEIPMETRVVSISVTSRDPQLAAKLANLYADNIAMEEVRKSSEANSYAQRYLTEQIGDTRRKLELAERDVNEYAKTNKIVAQVAAPSDDTNSAYSETVTVATLTDTNAAYNETVAKRILAQQRWAAVSGIPATQLKEVQDSEAIQNVMGKRAEAAGELAEATTRYGDSHPQVRELRAQVGTLDRQIGQQAAAVKNAIRLEYEVARRQEAGLGGELTRASGNAIDEQDRRVGYNQLTRDSEALSNQLKVLLGRYNELASAANLKQSSVTKLDPAQVPTEPFSPNLKKNLIIALLMGLGLGIALGVLREALDDRLRSLEDVESKLGMPLLGQTPSITTAEMKDADSDQYIALMESYSSIRAVLDSTLPRGQNVIQVTSSQPNEGKSFTAATLARKSAQIGRKVLLVDADLRRPSVASNFAFKRPERGTAEVLLGNATLEDTIVDVGVPNLSVLPVGTIPPNPVELLSSGAVEAFIDRYRSKYDLIIFDSSPVIGLADSLRLSHAVDATIFMAEANRAHYGQIKAAVRQLRSAGANIVGVILSKYNALNAGQYYAYNYAYYNYGEKSAA